MIRKFNVSMYDFKAKDLSPEHIDENRQEVEILSFVPNLI